MEPRTISDKELNEILPMLKRNAMYLTRDKHDADDLVQDTMLKIYEKEYDYSNTGNILGFCFIMMKNIFINKYHYRKRRSSKMVDFEYAKDNYIVNKYDSTTQYEDNDLLDYIKNHLKTRYVISVSSGYSYEYVSKRAGKPIGTIKSAVFRDREIVNGFIRKEGIRLDK